MTTGKSSRKRIHPASIVEKGAELDEGVIVGPFSIVGRNVRIGAETVVRDHVTVAGHTTIGQKNDIGSHAVLGGPPQHLGYRGEPTRLVIGDRNIFREYVTIHTGTTEADGVTSVGNDNMIMAYCHIAHDCLLEDGIIMANGVQIGGHVKIERDANFGGLAAVHHFCTIGRGAFVGGLTRAIHDVPPFTMVEGHPARVKCINQVGLERKGYAKQAVEALETAFRMLYRSGVPKAEATKQVEERFAPEEYPEVAHLVRFLRQMERGRRGRAREAHRKEAPLAVEVEPLP